MTIPQQSLLLLFWSATLIGCTGQQVPTSFDPLGPAAAANDAVPKSTALAMDTLFLPGPVEVERRTTSYLPPGNVRCGLADKAGNLWFGTWEGIVRYDGKAFTLFAVRDGPGRTVPFDIYTVHEDAAGNIWFGTSWGVYRTSDGRTFTSFTLPDVGAKDRNDDPGMRRVTTTTVLCILEDRRGALWFGTHGSGVFRYDGTSLSHLSITDGLCHDVVQDMMEDTAGNLWFATRGGGVCRSDGRSFVGFKAEDVIGNHVFFLSADRTGVPWIGTVGGGLRRFDGKTFTAVSGPELLNATSMLEASSGDRWFSSDGSGVVRYDGTSYTRITTKEGLCGNSVWSVVEDKDKGLWFCTREGLCRYDGRSFTTFEKEKN